MLRGWIDSGYALLPGGENELLMYRQYVGFQTAGSSKRNENRLVHDSGPGGNHVNLLRVFETAAGIS